MQSKDTALHRIKKQLALAGNAAASDQEKKTALKMAQTLMRQHNLTDTELTASTAGETETPANVKKSPAEWESNLATVCAQAFNCLSLFKAGICPSHRGRWLFIGTGQTHEIAAYAFAVQLRQLIRDRSEFIKTKLANVKTPQRKTTRANNFAEYWVNAAADTVQLSDPDEATSTAISAYLSIKYPHTTTLQSRVNAVRRKIPETDAQAGNRKGSKARLSKAVNSTGQQTNLLR